MVSVLPQTPPGSPFMQKILVLNPAADGWVEASSRKPRSTSDMPVRIICEDCNGTWMNGYERTVIALMEAAQAGPSIRLDRGQQSALATWACIVAILSQYLSAQTQVTRRRIAGSSTSTISLLVERTCGSGSPQKIPGWFGAECTRSSCR